MTDPFETISVCRDFYVRRVPPQGRESEFEVHSADPPPRDELPFQLTLEDMEQPGCKKIIYIGHQWGEPKWASASGLPEALIRWAKISLQCRIFSGREADVEGGDFQTEDARRMWSRFERQGWTVKADTRREFGG